MSGRASCSSFRKQEGEILQRAMQEGATFRFALAVCAAEQKFTESLFDCIYTAKVIMSISKQLVSSQEPVDC